MHSYITEEYVTIQNWDPDRTVNRAIYDGKNGNPKSKNARSQDRAGYDTHVEWSIVDNNLGYILVDPAAKVSKDDFGRHCAYLHWGRV